MAARSVWWLRFGVVGLGLEGGAELDGGLVVAAAFADRFVGAVGRDGPVAPAVGEHAAVFGGELLEALLWVGGGVERVDLRGGGDAYSSATVLFAIRA